MLWLAWRGVSVNHCGVKHQNPAGSERILFSATRAEGMASLPQKCPADVVDTPVCLTEGEAWRT